MMKSIYILLFCATVLLSGCRPHKSEPTVHGVQPELTVSLQPGSTATGDVARVVAAAKSFWSPPTDYWPEPYSVSEQETFWAVYFLKKQYRVGELIKVDIPGGTCIQVEKDSFSCSIVPAL